MIPRIRDLAVGATIALTLLSSTTTALSPSDVPADTPVSQILKLASSALSSGSSQDALSYYDLAIARDPSNYLTIFKRGATYLSLGRPTQASADFDKVLSIKPDFEGALTQRAKLRARAGDFSGAKADYAAAGGKDGEIAELAEAEGAAVVAKDAAAKNDWEACVTQAGAAIMLAPAAMDLRRLRAECRLQKGDAREAVSDLQYVVAVNPSDTKTGLLVSALDFYAVGETTRGVEAVKKCLHSDPEHKECAKLFKREKKADRELVKARALAEKRTFTGVVKILAGVGSEEPGLIQTVREDAETFRKAGYIHANAPLGLVTTLLEMTCNAYLEMNNIKRGTPHCTELLKHDPASLSGLLHKGQTELASDDFEAAIRTLNTAKDEHGQTNKIAELLQKAQTLLKRSKTKDYYKILGVDRDAAPKEIKRAYLRMSKQHHPDKISGDDKDAKLAAEKKMAGINEAYEVLKDPELRERFDHGDDPNDPEAQSRGHGGPFHGSPFGPGGGHQQFVFRSGPGGGGGFPGGFAEQMFAGGGFPGGGGGGGFHFGF